MKGFKTIEDFLPKQGQQLEDGMLYRFKGPVDCLDQTSIIKQSPSQAGQDLFVIAMLQGKKNGTFFELGCGNLQYHSNTYLLDREFNFSGISIDKADDHNSWSQQRTNTTHLVMDALDYDYGSMSAHYDYLQVDIDPPLANLDILKLAVKNSEFSVITFEHDAWNNKEESEFVRQESRKFLTEHGYELVVNDVTIVPRNGIGFIKQPIYFEDWWVNPKYVDSLIINCYKWVDYNLSPKYSHDILFKKEAQ